VAQKERQMDSLKILKQLQNKMEPNYWLAGWLVARL